MFYDILARKNVFLSYKKKKFKKSKKCHFSKGVSPWFWSKIGQFSIFFFKGNIGKENVFYDIVERENAFLGYKKKKFKKWKIVIFGKELIHGFGQKLAIFPNFFLRQYSRGKCVFRYFRTKKRLFRL